MWHMGLFTARARRPAAVARVALMQALDRERRGSASKASRHSSGFFSVGSGEASSGTFTASDAWRSMCVFLPGWGVWSEPGATSSPRCFFSCCTFLSCATFLGSVICLSVVVQHLGLEDVSRR